MELLGENFKKWFKGSKVVDEKGEPLVVYHGTDRDFTEFKDSAFGKNDSGYAGRGFYFSKNENIANTYADKGGSNGGNIKPVYLNLKNPFNLDDFKNEFNPYSWVANKRMKYTDDGMEFEEAGLKASKEWTNEAIKRGYDGAIGDAEIVAFEPTQIKSINNNGNFDKNNPNILQANLGHNMAGGFAGGADATINQRDDGDGEFTAKDLAYGVGAGVAGINAVKKVAPKLFEDGSKGGMKAGLFAGSKAKGFNAKAKSGKVFDGKYDGMERFEIDDSKATIKATAKELNKAKNERLSQEKDAIVEQYESGAIPFEEAKKLADDILNQYNHTNSGTFRLDDVLDHKELFDNYPKASEMKVTFTDMPKGASGYFDNQANEIVINTNMSNDEIKSSLLHELQHSIQKKEGFARGGSAQEFYNDAKKKIDLLKYELEFEPDEFIKDKMLSKLEKLEDVYENKGKEEAFNMYQKLAGEIEARDVQARADYTPKQRDEIAPYSSENIAPEDANVRFNNGNEDLVKNMSESSPEKLKGNFADRAIRKAVKAGAKTLDDIFGNKISGVYNSIKEKQVTDRIFGHKIYEKDDYMKWRDDALRERSERGLELEHLHKQLAELPDDARIGLYDYMTGNKNVNLSPALKALGEKYIKEIDDKGLQLVKEGVLSQEAFDTWKGAYLKRRYGSKMGSAKNAYNKAKGKGLDPVHARGKIWKGSINEYNKLEANGELGNVADGKIEAIELPNDKFQFRRDWTKEERAKMGEIKDASFSIPDTLSHLDEMVAHAKLLRKVAGKYVLDPIKVNSYTKGQLEDSGYLQLNGAKYGALDGQYVERSVANDIQELNTQINGVEGSVQNAIAEYMKWYKSIHTIYNPKTHFNNIMSNLVGFSFMEGRTLKTGKIVGKEVGKAFFPTAITTKGKADALIELQAKQSVGTANKKELNDLINLQNDADVQLWLDARKNGLFGKDQLNDVLNTYMQPKLKKVDGIGSKIHQKSGEVYQFEDDIVRFALFKQFKEDGKDTINSIREVGKIVPDYSKPMSEVANFLRRYGIAPFIAFPYYATPIMMRQIAERPTRPMALAGMIYALYQAQGMDMFDENDAPERFRKSYAPFMKSGDKTYGVKYDRWLPHLDLMKIHKMPIDTLWSSNPYISLGGAVAGLVDDNGGYSPYFNSKITYNKGLEGKGDILKSIAQGFITPDILDTGIGLINSLARSEKSRKTHPVYNPKNAGQNLLNTLGLNTTSFNRSAQKKKVRQEKLSK